MGCTGSKRQHAHEHSPLTELQIRERIEAPTECKTLAIAGVKMRYAWVSQRGYYPDALDKENQDSYVCIPQYSRIGSHDQAFWGVFDGHGRDGNHCSRFARDTLPNQILDGLEKVPAASLTPSFIMTTLRDAHLTTNLRMHAQKKFDDNLSGTTSISVFMRGRTLYVSNVGDSRAIIVSFKDGRLVAKPLSNDQTPYRKDERERIKKTGARVMSMDQIEGLEPIHENWGDLNLGEDIDEGGDPPRVWCAKGDYPGTAFTRSLGDRIAEECGVNAEPEILERQLEPSDKYLIIASDGVFEFLTNQMVADECAHHTDPLMACKAVVAQAYHLWLQYEIRTDDITMLAVYLDEVPAEPAPLAGEKAGGATAITTHGSGLAISGSGGPVPLFRQTSLEMVEQRPVRRVMSREKRKHMIEVQTSELSGDAAYEAEEITEEEMQALMVPKTPAEAELIGSAIKSNFLFQHLNAAQREAVIGLMRAVPVKAGDRIIRQGDRGDRFYLIDHGRFEVRVRPTLPPPAPSAAVAGPGGLPPLPPSRTHTPTIDDAQNQAALQRRPSGSGAPELQRRPSGSGPPELQRRPSGSGASELQSQGLPRRPSGTSALDAQAQRRPSGTSAFEALAQRRPSGTSGLPSGRSTPSELINVESKKSNSLITAVREKSSTLISIERAPTAVKIAFEPDAELLGNVVHVYEASAHSHPGFGELSLMYGKPRAASVLALTDGKLWSLDRRVFARVVLRPRDVRRAMIRTLKQVKLLEVLTVAQLQRLTDLMNEESFPAGTHIIKQGERAENFYIIVSGTAECTINRPDGSGTDVVMRLKENDYFGERALLEDRPRAANVIATSDIKVLFIGKTAFDMTLGSLATIIDNDRKKREAIAAARHSASVPHSFEEIVINNVIDTDVLGTLFLGTFGTPAVSTDGQTSARAEPNVTVRTFLLSEIERKSLNDSLSRFIDAAKAILGNAATKDYPLIPRPLSFIQDVNAIHIPFNQPIVADLTSFVRSEAGAVTATPDMVAYAFACLVSALEALHGMNILYRAVQPDSLFVDTRGRIVLLDYRVCRIGLVGNSRTFTICGAADYLSPEQIAQSGHSYPVDLWGMGLLLYEISVGTNPFAAASEVATYSRISSFGTQTFPSLAFPETISPDCKSLINQLLVPEPTARIGAGSTGFAAIRRHGYYKAYEESWTAIQAGTKASPFAELARNEKEAMMLENVDPNEFKAFKKEYTNRTMSEEWLNSLAF